MPIILRGMNTASQDLQHHLSVLREKMSHPNNYELAATYFLEEFAGDLDFLAVSEPDQAPHILTVLTNVTRKILGDALELTDVKVFRLTQYKFYHGCAAVASRALLFFYFEEDSTGVFIIFPGCQGTMDVGRFQIPNGLCDPREN